MKQHEMADALHRQMQQVHVTPALRKATLAAVHRKEETKVKRKISASLVLALVIVALCAVALAAANRLGMLDFVSRYANTSVPEDAASYVQQDVAAFQGEGVQVDVRESYYDGRTVRLIVDITPKDKGMLLLGVDSSMQDRWQDLVSIAGGEMDQTDTRTIYDAYVQGGYTSAWQVNMYTREALEGTVVGGSLDFALGEDGVLTYYLVTEFDADLPQRDVELTVNLMPYTDPKEGLYDYNARVTASTTIGLTAASRADAQAEEMYVNTEPVDYEQIGVRVDRVLMTVKPMEIYVSIDYTVTDRDKYRLTDDGLWFEFIDPQKGDASEPWSQRLEDGITGSSGIEPLDGDVATATRYRQSQTLALSERSDTYILRAYECWEKQRFDTHTIDVRPATAQDAQEPVTNELSTTQAQQTQPSAATDARIHIADFYDSVPGLKDFSAVVQGGEALEIAESGADTASLRVVEAAYDGRRIAVLLCATPQAGRALFVPCAMGEEYDKETSAQAVTGSEADAGMTAQAYADAQGATLYGVTLYDASKTGSAYDAKTQGIQRVVGDETYMLFFADYENTMQRREACVQAEIAQVMDGSQQIPTWQFVKFEIEAK